MELKDILAKCDHTLLTQTATWAEIKGVCDDGMKYHTASVCIPASYVKQAKEYVGDKLPICTVIGFPNGYDTTAAKCFMASDAVANGADEVDMVINIGWAKDGLWERITEEIAAVRSSSKPACSPTRKRSPCASASPTPARTTSRLPRASPRPVRPSTTWSCSPRTSRPM